MVCPYSLSRPGGVQGQAIGLSRALGARGHSVSLLAPDDGHRVGLSEALDAQGVATYVVGRSTAVRANGSVAPLALSPGTALRVDRWVARLRPDVVHLHEPMAPATGYACLVRHRVPTVATFHRSGASPWYRALRPLSAWAVGHVDVRCAVSEAAAATAEAALGGTYEVLFNGIDGERFAGAQAWPTEVPTVLFVGRHEARKGLGVLLEAFAAVPGRACLWVAGEGPETARLRDGSKDPRVQWLGRLADDALARRLAGAQVLCAPSLRGESFGVDLLEAMAAGCAVVASDLAGYRAACGGHAELVPPGDPGALAGELAEALADAEAATGRSGAGALDAARSHARQWSMSQLAARYEEVYARAVAAVGRAHGAVA